MSKEVMREGTRQNQDEEKKANTHGKHQKMKSNNKTNSIAKRATNMIKRLLDQCHGMVCVCLVCDSFSTSSEAREKMIQMSRCFLPCFSCFFGIQRSDNGECNTNNRRQLSVKAHVDKGISE